MRTRRPAGILVALCAAIVLACAPGFARAAKVQQNTLASTLHGIEQRILRNPWTAHAELRRFDAEAVRAPAPLKALYYTRLAEALYLLNLEEDFTAAIAAGRAALTPATPPATRLQLEVLRAVAAERAGNYDEAARVARAAAQGAEAAGLPGIRVAALTELGYISCQSGDWARAMEQLQSAYALATTLPDVFHAATVDEVYGVLYAYMGEYEKAIENYAKSLKHYAALGYLAYQAEATNGIALTYRDLKRWDEAIEAFQRYRRLTEDNGSEHGIFTAYYGLGTTYAEKGDCPEALQAIDAALAVNGPEDYKAELYKRQAVCLAGKGDAAGARAALERAGAIFARIPELQGTSWAIDLQFAEARVLARLGDHAAAYDRLLHYHEDAAALERRNGSERMLRMRLQMEDTRKDLQIALLEQQSNVRTLELERQERALQVQRYTIAFWVVATFAVIGFVLMQHRNHRTLRDLSTRDGLTGLFNRRHVFEQLERLIAALPADRGQLSIVLFDVDDFKKINDTHGHPGGDAVLRQIAAICPKLLRSEDTMARIGGEEFLCVLPRANAEVAARIAERMLAAIREHDFALPGGASVHLTVSIGIASFDAGAKTADSLYTRADRALYLAKSGGKDRIRTG